MPAVTEVQVGNIVVQWQKAISGLWRFKVAVCNGFKSIVLISFYNNNVNVCLFDGVLLTSLIN